MKCLILAGGRGTRLAEESAVRPKPMVEVGGRPMLWHIMKSYAAHGVTDFVICLGYRGYVVKEYFANYFLHSTDVTVDMRDNEMTFHDSRAEPWRVTLVDTGEHTMTGGRLLRARRYLDDETFCMTYGDGVGDIDITAELAFHAAHGLAVTMTVVRPPARFGHTVLDGDRVARFDEKPVAGEGHINGGFFVIEPRALDVIAGDEAAWESSPLTALAEAGEVAAWRHDGYWQPMDTLRDRQILESAWQSGQAPWRVWE